MNKLVVTVGQELVNYIERLSYEEASYKDIILTMLENHKNDADGSSIDNPVFKAYQDKYSNAKTEYELAKSKITAEYIPECLREHQCDWNLDYSTCKLTITVKCECGQAALEEYLACKEN